ncbi:MAG: hypothetical protein QOJ31_1587, partial [Gaiellales bacterium]|nr:hypothetical protein [Gaiellales bacterium]
AKLHAAIADLIHDEPEAAWVEEHLRALAGVETDAPTGRDRQNEAGSAWRRFLEALADRNPLVLVFEDLHWADDALLDFIDHLVDWASGVPLLVVCTARPELLDRRRGWGGGKRNALTIALSALADDDIARMIGGLLEQTVLPVETQVTLLSRAEGNPLYAEEYVRMLIDRGFLRHEGDRWRLAAESELPVPESVQGLIAARLDDLPADEKRLLQDASVLGKVVWLGALAAMGGGDRFMVEERLHALERREMLRRERRSSVGGETEYAFRHVLMRDVAYGQIPRAQRADKHRRAAEWIESLSADRDNAPDMLAHHYSHALGYARDSGQPTAELERRTRLAYRDAAERATALNSLTSAQNHYLAAMALWPEDDPEWPALVVETADISLGTYGDEVTLALGRARDRLVADGDLGNAAKAEMLVGFRFWNEAMSEESITAFSRAGELLEGAEPTPTVARVLSRLAGRTMVSGHFDETIEFCRRALTIADQFGLEDIRGHVLNTQGVARVSHGDLGGLADVEASIEIAERLNAADALIRGYKNFASVLAELGDLERSVELQRRGLDAANRFGADYQSRWFETELGIHAYWAGDWDAAEAAFNRLGEWVAEVGPHYMEAAARSYHGQIRVARGEHDRARRDIESSLDFGRRSADPQMLLPTLGDAALAAAMTGAADSARRVAALFDELATAIADGGEGGYWAVTAALALALTEQPERFAVASIGGPSRWMKAARMIVEGRFVEAAGELAAIGGRPQEALARLLAARSLIGDGRRDEGEAQLGLAIGFWNDVGATRLAALAETLVARSA